MIQHYVVAVHQVDVAVIVNRHATQLLYDKVEVNIHADDADELPLDEERRDIGYDVEICYGVDVRFNPSRGVALLRDVIPADIRHVFGSIKRKVNRFTFNERRQRPFPMSVNPLHGKTALRPFNLWNQSQVVGNTSVHASRNCVEVRLHFVKIIFSIGGVVYKSVITFNRVQRVKCHAVRCLTDAKKSSVQSFATNYAHCAQRFIRVSFN